MAISFSEKRIAVLLLSQPFKAAALAAALSAACASIPVKAESLFDEMRNPNANGLSGYVLVSAYMPEATLIALARDARRTGMMMVVNGYAQPGPGGLAAMQARVAAINTACCGKSGAHWQVNPLLFERYKVAAVPAFVIARGAGGLPGDYSKVSGEMGVANALKFFAQQSQQPDIRRKATEIYTRAFSTQ
jgi:conjugal transfer pilus assembly protein TrbC